MNDIDINDKRNIKDFKGISFSGYKRSDVRKELLNSLDKCKIEPACYWASELICAGLFAELWEIILLFMSKYIHLGNPNLPIYIDMRFQNFKNIVMNGYQDDELRMRNSPKIRTLFSEIICISCNSPRKHRIESIKIKKTEEFDMTHMTTRLKAPTITYAQEIFLKDDPKELFIAMNEFCYNISQKIKNSVSACYWIEWIIEFESICKKRKDKCLCERRVFAPVEEKQQMDVIWLIWDALINECKKRKDRIGLKVLNALLSLFSLKFTNGIKKKRRYILYFAVELLTETINYKVNIVHNQQQINQILNKINLIYKEIKKNEITPNTDYLFNNISRSNLEKTIEKIDTMNGMLGNYIPRKQ